MMHDIYAASMAGHYETRAGDELIERGEWSYQGYGNAEITMEAKGERLRRGKGFSLNLHSVERQIDQFAISNWSIPEEQGRTLIRGTITGHDIDLHITGGDGDTHEGSVSVPDETVYDGPSPIWMIHLMLVAPPPGDRAVTTPYVRLGLDADDVQAGFYRVSRQEKLITLADLDEEGNEVNHMEIEITEDGCPTVIRYGDMVTEVVRVPQVAGL